MDPAVGQRGAADSFPVTEAFRGMRLDRFLQAMLPRMSRSSIQDAIATRVTCASGAVAKPSRRLAVGDVVLMHARAAANGPLLAIPVLAAGSGWTVVDKPAGLATTPSARRPGEDVATRLGLAPAHRLDRATSGCLLLTRGGAIARHFDLAFRERRVAKEYVAVVEGSPAADSFVVDAPLGPDAASRVPSKVAVMAHGVAASTQVDVLARLGDRTVVRARPLTGRRHQIRAHLAHAGHAIVGDLVYGGDERRFQRFQLGQQLDTPAGLAPGRHLLHALRLSFPDPAGSALVEVEAPWPADFAAVHAAAPREGPVMVDPATMRRRLALLQDALADLRRYRARFDGKALAADRDAQHMVLHALYVAAQTAIDLALHAGADTEQPTSTTYQEAFERLPSPAASTARWRTD